MSACSFSLLCTSLYFIFMRVALSSQLVAALSASQLVSLTLSHSSTSGLQRESTALFSPWAIVLSKLYFRRSSMRLRGDLMLVSRRIEESGKVWNLRWRGARRCACHRLHPLLVNTRLQCTCVFLRHLCTVSSIFVCSIVLTL